MADDDNETEGKSVIPGAIAGTLVGGGSAAVATRMATKNTPEKLKAADAALLEATKAFDTKLNAEIAIKGPYEAFKNAELLHNDTAKDYLDETYRHWNSLVNPVQKGTITVARLEGQAKHLKGLPVTEQTKEGLTVIEGQVKALKEVMAKPDFAALSQKSPKKAIDALVSAYEDSYQALKPSKEVEKVLYGSYLSQSALEAMKKADPQLAASIAEKTKASATELANAKKNLEETKNAWKKVEESALKTESAAKAAADKSVKNLTEVAALQKKGGFVKFPKLFSHLTGKAKFAVVTATLVGAIAAYKVVQAMHGGPGGTHAERIDQERTGGGAEPSRA